MKKVGLLFLSGLLISFAHPFRYQSFSLEPSWGSFFIVSLGLLFFMHLTLPHKKGMHRFLSAFFIGVFFYLITLYWIEIALHDYGEIPQWQACLVCLLLSSYCAIYFGIWSLVCGLPSIRRKAFWIRALLGASLWSSLEAVRQVFITGFPWGELGFHFYFSPWLSKTASFWGTHGLTFWWIFFIGSILYLDQWWKMKKEKMALFLMSSIFLLGGGVALFLFPKSTSTDLNVKIALLQPNIPQEVKWEAEWAEHHLQTLLKMTEQAHHEQVDLIVWPETAYPYLTSSNQTLLPLFSPTPVLIGAVVREKNVNKNSSLLIFENKILSRYDKIHLVPFGEYVPLQKWLSFGKLVVNSGNFEHGSKAQLPQKHPSRPLQIGSLICYEDIFNRESVRHAREGANILVNLTNDAWYGQSSASAQHAQMALLQFYQTGLPMIRATNNGITLFASHREILTHPPFAQNRVIENIQVSPTPKKTFFVWTYPLMEWIWVIIFIIGVIG